MTYTVYTAVFLLVTLTAHVSRVHGLYSHSDDVIQLDGSDFHSKVIMSDELWLVEFYAPWCGHCKSLAPEWKKAATALKGIVNIAAVDADAHQQVGGQYGVRGFPTIKIFGADKFKPQDFQGQRTAQGIIDTAFQQLRSLVNMRMSGGGGSSGGGGGGGKSSGGGSSSGGSGKAGDPGDVVELTDSNFDDLVINSNDMWLVEFFAPWCGHCKNLAPHWAQAATELKGKVKLGALDATVHPSTAQRYGVHGYPTIKYFAAGAKDGSAEEYDGGRTGNDIISWALQRAADNIPAPDVIQLTESAVLSSACDDHQLCVISILPHILDCQSSCRNDYLKMLKGLGEKYKKKEWGWVWVEAAAQLQLEDALGIGGFGYPAMATVNSRKMKYALLRGPFSETGINEFLRELSFGRGSTAPVKNAKLPDIDTTEAWDGKDGELPEEEEIDLSDVELDDLEKVEL